MKKLPLYDIRINETDETGIEFNSLVERPAHGKEFLMFEKEQELFFDAESKTLIGCAIAVDEEIFRNSPTIGEHLVKFSKESVKQIVIKLSKGGIFNSVNTNHETVVDGIYLTGMFQIDEELGIKCPEKLKGQKLADGSLITIYHVENQEIIKNIENKNFNGFSIEGIFEKIKLKQQEMKNPFEKFMKKKEVFANAVSEDGTKLTWDGEIEIGSTVLMVVNEDETTTPAVTKEFLISTESGEVMKVTTNEEGIITEVMPVEEQKADEKEEEKKEEVAAESEEVVKLKAENEDLKIQLSKFNKQFNKFETAKKDDKIDFFAMAQRIKNK